MKISDITTKSIIHEGVYFLKPGQLRGSWRDSELRKLGFKQAKNGGWFTDRSNWDKLEKMGEKNWRSLLSEEELTEGKVSADRAIQFFKHFHKKYGGKPELNLWKVSRITNTKYRDLERELHKQIARGDVPKEFAFRKDLITLEGEQIINEVPLPSDWDEEVYRGKGTFKNRIQYALDRAKKIGAGSSRVAFIIEYEGRPTVLKIAKNKKGLAQNNVEASILDDYYAQSLGILIPLIDYDTENPEPLWVHTELAEKATEKQLCNIMKCPGMLERPNSKMSAGGLYVLVDLAKIITGQYANTSASDQLKRIQEKTGMSDQDLATLEEYASRLADLSVNFDLVLGDIDSARNWGIYKGKPVIIDIGLSSDVYTSMYQKR